jgi:hypothetical protein
VYKALVEDIYADLFFAFSNVTYKHGTFINIKIESLNSFGSA